MLFDRELAEWFNVTVSKTVISLLGIVGSNPTFSTFFCAVL